MKLLWFSHFVPFPPRGGGSQRSYHLLRQAAKSHQVHLVAFNLRNYSPGDLAECASEFSKLGASVEFWQLPLRWESPLWWFRLLASPLSFNPYSCSSFWSRELAKRWFQTIRRFRPDLIHFDSIDLALFEPATRGLRKVLNHHNCESAMMDRRAENEPNRIKKLYLRSQARKLYRMERILCPVFSVNLAVSEVDAAALRSRAPRAHFHIVENGTDTAYFVPTDAPSEPKSLIFTGSLDWYANVSAMKFFRREIWPLMKQQCPQVRLYLAGRKPTHSLVRWMRHDPNVVVVADPEDIRPWLARAAAFICPTVDGGGTRLKILDALAMRKAVVSTAIGCEGLQVTHGENILVADAPGKFAHEVLRVLENEALRQRLGAAGRTLVEKEYSWDVIGEHLEQAYRCAMDRGSCSQRIPGAQRPDPCTGYCTGRFPR
jgi:glycosyltransferase involved in cell wall biosynthesis